MLGQKCNNYEEDLPWWISLFILRANSFLVSCPMRYRGLKSRDYISQIPFA